MGARLGYPGPAPQAPDRLLPASRPVCHARAGVHRPCRDHGGRLAGTREQILRQEGWRSSKEAYAKGTLKARSEDSDQYAVGGLDPKFYNLRMGDSTRRTIADAFLIDEVCLGYSTEMFLDDAGMPQMTP